MLRCLWKLIGDGWAKLMQKVGVELPSGQGAGVDEKEAPATNATPAGETAGSPKGERCPELRPDGKHVYPVVDVSIPAHGVTSGTGEITWHPEGGLRFHVEAVPGGMVSGIEAVLAQFTRPSVPLRGAGAVFEPSRNPEIVARVVGTGETIRVYQIAAQVRTQSQSGTAGVSAKTICSGTAVAATVRIERDSELSYWHDTLGPCRLLVPDVRFYQWPTQDYVTWTSGDTEHSSFRSSCRLSDTPKLTLFSGNPLPQTRNTCWLVFEPELIPDRERDWYIPDECRAAKSLLSFLCGKRLPFLWTDRFLDDAHVTRTYHGMATVDDFPQANLSYQPVPLQSLEHGGAVMGSLCSLFTTYLKHRRWFDLDWVVGPLWYAIKAYLDDKLGFASVSLERFSTAHDAFLEENPGQKRPKVKFLTKYQSKLLRKELSDAVEAFAKEKGIDLTTSRSSAAAAIIEAAVDSIANLDDSLFPDGAIGEARSNWTFANRSTVVAK